MASMKNITEGLAILQKYVRSNEPDDKLCATDHDILFAGPCIPEEVFSAKDRAGLEANGWHYAEDCWACST